MSISGDYQMISFFVFTCVLISPEFQAFCGPTERKPFLVNYYVCCQTDSRKRFELNTGQFSVVANRVDQQ